MAPLYNLKDSMPINRNHSEFKKLKKVADEWYKNWFNVVNIELQTGKSIKEILQTYEEDDEMAKILQWLDENFVPVRVGH